MESGENYSANEIHKPDKVEGIRALQDMYSPIAVNALGKQLQDGYRDGNLQMVRDADFRISRAEYLRLGGEILARREYRRHQDSSAIEELFDKKTPSFSSIFKDTLIANKDAIIRACETPDEIYILYEAQGLFNIKMNKSQLEPYRAKQFLHSSSIEDLMTSDKGLYQGNDIKIKRFEEVLSCVLESKNPDINDFEFFSDIIKETSNKFLRSVAIKKAVDIFRVYQQMMESVSDGDNNTVPSISQLYDDLTIRGIQMPRRDFLFTLPFIVKDGIVQEDLLRTAIKTNNVLNFRKGSSAENTYFSSMVDLYSSDNPSQLHPLFQMLQRELVFVRSPYYQKTISPRLQQRRNTIGLTENSRYLSYSELKSVHAQMQARLVEKYFPEDYKEIMEVYPKDQAGLLNDFFEAYRSRLPRETKQYAEDNTISDAYEEEWIKELKTVDGVGLPEITEIKRFDKLLKKISALTVISSHDNADFSIEDFYNEIRGQSLEQANKMADALQIDQFIKLFSISTEERKRLEALSNFRLRLDLAEQKDRITELYKQYENFNAFFLLLDRYQNQELKIEPKEFRDNLAPLLKEVVAHIIKGDFKEWRNTIPISIQGKPYDPWPISLPAEGEDVKDEQLLRLKVKGRWRRDDQSTWTAEAVETLPPLIDQIASKSPHLLPVIDDPTRYFKSLAIWKDEGLMRAVSGDAGDFFSGVENAKTFLEWMSDDEQQTLDVFKVQVSVKDKAAVGRLKKHARILLAQEALYKKLNQMKAERKDPMTHDVFADFRQIVSQLNPSENFRSSEDFDPGSDEEIMIKFLKELEEIFRKGAMGPVSYEIIDSSDPFDLITVGQPVETICNCMSYEGDPKKNAYILDIVTSRNKKVILAKQKGRTVARGVMKFLTGFEDEGLPVIVVEDILSDGNHVKVNEFMMRHIQQKFEGIDVVIGEPVFIHPKDRAIVNAIINGEEYDIEHSFETKKIGEVIRKINGSFQTNLFRARHTGSRVGSELPEKVYQDQPREMINTSLIKDIRYVKSFNDSVPAAKAAGT